MGLEGLPDPLRIELAITGILERLGVPYVTAGSLASSLHGVPRSTDDIDLVADLLPAHAAALVTMLGGDWYVSEEAVRDAIARGGSPQRSTFASHSWWSDLWAGAEAMLRGRLQGLTV